MTIYQQTSFGYKTLPNTSASKCCQIINLTLKREGMSQLRAGGNVTEKRRRKKVCILFSSKVPIVQYKSKVHSSALQRGACAVPCPDKIIKYPTKMISGDNFQSQVQFINTFLVNLFIIMIFVISMFFLFLMILIRDNNLLMIFSIIGFKTSPLDQS